MAHAVLDYYHADQVPPVITAAPDSIDDPIYIYVRDRLIDSFDITGDGSRFLAYSSPVYPNGDEGIVQEELGIWLGKSWVSYQLEWPKIRADIDANNPSPLALVQTDSLDIGKNHQVAAYAYRRSGQKVQLWIYDPNHPDHDDDVLTFDVSDTSGEVHVTRSIPDNERIWCFFRINNYNPHLPPGGRNIGAITVRDALQLATESRNGTLPESIAGMTRPASLRQFVRSI